MFPRAKIATGAVAGILTFAVTGAAALAAFQPMAPLVSAAAHATDAQTTAAERGERGGPFRALEAVLERLVQNGTITSEQKAEILEAVAAAGRDRAGADRDRDGHLKRIWNGFMRLSLEYLELEKDDAREALRAGASLGELADASLGKSRDALIAYLVSEATALIDQALANEKITAEQAQAAEAGLAERVAAFVDRVHGNDATRELRERAKDLRERAKELRDRLKEQRDRLKEQRSGI
ncbi:MAG: hypothetical protein ACRDGT_03310 [Candidatus Limnocylindria bacterium]